MIHRHQVEHILQYEGVFRDGEQVRPVNRDDLLKLIEVNGGTGEYIDLSGLDLSGIDIRGMQLGSVLFEGCILRKALAQPLITHKGKEFLPWDRNYVNILSEYQTGRQLKNHKVVPTNLAGTSLLGADLSYALLCLANVSGVSLSWGTLDSANLAYANLSKSNLDQASLERTNLRYAVLDGASLQYSHILDADLSDASLKGVSLDGTFLSPLTKMDGVQWDPDFISPLEIEGNYESAARQYRQLKEWYDRAGKRDIAGKFHYREREAERKAEWQSIRKSLSSVWHRIRHPMTEV